MTNTVVTDDLTIQKVVSGDPLVEGQEFTFTATIGGDPYSGDYTVGTETKNTNDGTIVLKDGETATIAGLPYGQTFSVVETVPDGYTNAAASASGTIGTSNADLVMTNTVVTDNLTITKAVEVAPLNADDEFSFLVEIGGDPYNGDYTVGTETKNTTDGTIILKTGETAQIAELPYGQTFVVTETVPVGYTNANNIASGTIGMDNAQITMTNKPLTDISGMKVWVDGSNSDEGRPTIDADGLSSGITLTLYQGSGAGRTVVTGFVPSWVDNGNDTWTYTYTGLPKYAAGTEIVYSVEESGVPTDYEQSVGAQGQIVNTLVKDMSVEKVWVDGNNPNRPASVTVQLYKGSVAEGNEVGDPVPLTAPAWSYKWTGLPVYDANGVITYVVGENEVSGYATAIGNMDEDEAIEVTNVQLTQAVGTKVWNDGLNADRPSGIVLTLYANGNAVAPQPTPAVLTSADGTTDTYTWRYLPKYDPDNVQIIYTAVEEDANVPAGYARSVAQNGTVTNTQLRDIIGMKVWVDGGNSDEGRPTIDEGSLSDGITLTLYQGVEPNRTEVTGIEPTWEDNGDNTWTYTFTGLPKYDANGAEIVYSVEETGVPTDYEQSVGVDGEIVNTLLRDISGTKVWADGGNNSESRPTIGQDGLSSGITLTLYQGTGADRTEVTGFAPTWVNNGDNTWTYTYTGLPKYDANGAEIVYSVEETGVPTDYEQSEGTEGQIVNTLVTDISGTKVWADGSDAGTTRPAVDDFALKLYRQVGTNAKEEVTGFTPVETETGDTWTYAWSNLPVYEGTDAINYTVEEDAAPAGYLQSTVEGMILNTLVTDISGTKVWADGSDAVTTRPAAADFALKLYRQVGTGPKDEVTGFTPVETETGDTWTYVWNDLPVYEGTDAINYTVEEDAAPAGYLQSAVDGQIVNTLVTDIRGTKVWADGSDAGVTRPAANAFALKLYKQVGTSAKEEVTGFTPVETETGDTWTYVWNDLPVYEGTDAINYTVEEDAAPAGYLQSAVDGQIVNTLVTSFTATKAWDDAANSNRPASVTVQLYAGTAPYGQPVTLSADTTPAWSYTWQNLPVYDGTNEVRYSVVETNVPDTYRTFINGGAIFNTLNTPIVEIAKSVDKTRVLGGEQFAYTVTLTNRMLRPVTVTSVNDNLAAGQTFGAFTSQGSGSASYNAATRVITWSGTVPAASYANGTFVPGTTSFTFTVTANELVTLEEGYRLLQNGATGTYIDPYALDFPDPQQQGPDTYPLTSNIVNVEVLGPVMSITKETSKTDAHPGETMTYTLRVQSRSLLPFQVNVSDLLPSGVSFKNFVTTGFGEAQDAANPKQLNWNFTMPAATFNPDTLAVTAPSEVVLSFVVTLDAVTVDQDVITITNNAVLTPKKDDETPYDPIPSNDVVTNVTAGVTVSKAASVTDMYVGDPTQDRRWVYVFTLTNSNTAPMQVNLADAFDTNINFYNWVNSVSNNTNAFPRVVSQEAFQDPVTGVQSINATLMLAPATVDSQGNIIPSEMQYAVIVEGKYIALEGNDQAEIAVPNTGIYRVSTNIIDPINLQTAVRRNTNTATVVVWAINGVLPVTGEWIMLIVPFGGLMTLAGLLLLLMNRRKQHAK